MHTLNITPNRSADTQLAPDFSDALAVLRHCHRRIDNILAGLERAVVLLGSSAPDERAAAWAGLTRAQTYFSGAAAKHVADEEDSLFPRLRACGDAATNEALDKLAAEHRAEEELRAVFLHLAARWPRAGAATAHDLTAARQTVAALCAVYRPHIELEETVIIPAAARLLSDDELAAIGREMRARRAAKK